MPEDKEKEKEKKKIPYRFTAAETEARRLRVLELTSLRYTEEEIFNALIAVPEGGGQAQSPHTTLTMVHNDLHYLRKHGYDFIMRKWMPGIGFELQKQYSRILTGIERAEIAYSTGFEKVRTTVYPAGSKMYPNGGTVIERTKYVKPLAAVLLLTKLIELGFRFIDSGPVQARLVQLLHKYEKELDQLEQADNKNAKKSLTTIEQKSTDTNPNRKF